MRPRRGTPAETLCLSQTSPSIKPIDLLVPVGFLYRYQVPTSLRKPRISDVEHDHGFGVTVECTPHNSHKQAPQTTHCLSPHPSRRSIVRIGIAMLHVGIRFCTKRS